MERLMERETAGFVAQTLSEPEDEYLENYVVLEHNDSKTTYGGKLIAIEPDSFVLNPFQAVIVDSDGVRKRLLRNGNKRIPKRLIGTIEPTTRKNLENFCKYFDKMEREGKEPEKKSNGLIIIPSY